MPSAQEDNEQAEQTSSWRIIAMVVPMVVLVFVSLILSIVSSLIMPKFNLSPEDIASVSGYYGPGSVAAWLVLAFSNSEFMVLLKFISRLMTRRKPFSVADLYGLKIDAVIIGTLAYPVVAYVDLTMQTINGLKSEKSASIEHRIEPQLAVAHLSSAISILALCAHYYFLLIYVFVKDDEDFVRSHPVPMMRKRRTRLAMWTTIFTLSQTYIALLSFQYRASAVGSLKHYSSLVVVMVLALTLLVPDGESKGGSTKIAWVFCCLLMLLLFPNITLNVGKEFDVCFPWPQSSAKLSDLDQASALAVSLCTALASLAKWIARQVEEHRTSSSESDDEEIDDKPDQAKANPSVQGNPTSASSSTVHVEVPDSSAIVAA